MKISLTKLFAQDGKSEKYEIPLESEKFSIGGENYRVIEKHPVILGLTHEGNRVITNRMGRGNAKFMKNILNS